MPVQASESSANTAEDTIIDNKINIRFIYVHFIYETDIYNVRTKDRTFTLLLNQFENLIHSTDISETTENTVQKIGPYSS
jgi:hypothetical protein